MKLKRYLACIIILMVASCQSKDTRVVDKEKNITKLPAGDEKFLALKDTAQKHIDELLIDFEKHGHDTNYVYHIKSNYSDNGTNEHMWSKLLQYKAGEFTCMFTDSAYELHNIVYGDTVRMHKNDIEDWVIYNNMDGTQKGYFSEKYLRGE